MTTLPLTSAPTLRILALRAAVIAAFLGVCASLLFVKHPLGLNVPFFAGLCLVALVTLAALERIQPVWQNVWLIVPIIYFAAMTAVRAEPLVTALNLGATLGLTMLLARLFSQSRLLDFGVWDYIGAGIAASLEITILQPTQALLAAGHEATRPGLSVTRLWAVFRGLVFAIPIVILFTLLLTSADAAFNQATLDVLKAFGLDNLADWITRSLVGSLAAWISLGTLAYALREFPSGLPSAQEPTTQLQVIGFTETTIVLLSVNLLFAAFSILQFRYLFGGQSNIHVAGFTYADYARRGFAELVLVAVFTLGLGWAAQTLTRRTSTVQDRGFALLCAVMVGLTGVILASAFQRLRLYEEAYGFTRLRTYPHIFMIWVGVLLAIFLGTVLSRRPRLLAFGLLLAALGFTATLDLLDTDAFIVRQNLARYQESGQVDLEYLTTLSDDALPELLPLLQNPDPEIRTLMGGVLHYRLNELAEEQTKAGWPGWHWARDNAYRVLQHNRGSLEQYEPIPTPRALPFD